MKNRKKHLHFGGLYAIIYLYIYILIIIGVSEMDDRCPRHANHIFP